MTREEAIRVFEPYLKHDYPQPFQEACSMAISALREQEERSKGCEYCRGAESIYQHTNTTKISIKGQLGKKALIVESNPCPPYADCCMKDVPDRSAFIIRFCPECGRRLEEV